MSSPPSDQGTPDPYQRIEELESRVSELTDLVRLLVERTNTDGPAISVSSVPPSVEPEPVRLRMVDGVRESVQRALGGEPGESLESRIGGIWIGRVAALLLMTAVVLGGALALKDDTIQANHKVALGYALSAISIAYGLLARRREDLFAQTMLGCGMAVFYFVTYAGFFVDTMHLFPSSIPAIPVLGGCLIAIGIVCHFKRSQTAAGITLFLLYYTVVLTITEGDSAGGIEYSFIAIALVSVMALVFHLTHRWLFFTWAALIGAHLCFIYFFYAKPPALEMTDIEYFWFSNGLLTLTYIVFSVACITDARKTGEYRQTVAPMAGLNSFVYLAITWFSIRANYPEMEWAFRLGIAGMLIVFAIYANYSGPRRNYLFQFFLAKAVVIFTLAMQAYLSHEWLVIALALECLGLGMSYQRSGSTIFKVLELGLLAITFGACVWAIRLDRDVLLYGFNVPANWFCCVGAAIVFATTAAFFEHAVRKPKPSERTVKSQWFLADTFLDVSSHTAALIHAAAAALIVLMLTIMDLGSEPMLPFVLAGEALLFAVFGFALRTAQLEVASVLLLAAAHVSYHLFLALETTEFEEQPSFGVFTCLVSGFTFFGGYLWERYLQRIKGGRLWEHATLASIPYIGAYLMLAALLGREVPGLYVPLIENVVVLVLLLASAVSVLPGLRLAGVLALSLSTFLVIDRLFNDTNALAQPDFLWILAALVGTYFLAERLVSTWRSAANPLWGISDGIAAVIIATMVSVGVLGLWRWSPENLLTYYLLGFAVLTMIAGVGARASGHRWAALVIYSIAIVRAYVYDMTNLNQFYRFASFLALCVPLLVMSWAYSQFRMRALRSLNRAARSSEPPPSQ